MATSPQTKHRVTLEEFLRMPGIEDAPYLEFTEGRIEAKAMPNWTHARLSRGFDRRIEEYAEENGLGISGQEVRYTFAGRSILLDVSFQRSEHLDIDEDGRLRNLVTIAPDIHIEILSPDQSIPSVHAKLLFSVANGCPLGVLVNADSKTIDVYRPGRPPERLADDAAIDFAPALPGLSIPVAEVFGWLVIPQKRPKAGPA